MKYFMTTHTPGYLNRQHLITPALYIQHKHKNKIDEMNFEVGDIVIIYETKTQKSTDTEPAVNDGAQGVIMIGKISSDGIITRSDHDSLSYKDGKVYYDWRYQIKLVDVNIDGYAAKIHATNANRRTDGKRFKPTANFKGYGGNGFGIKQLRTQDALELIAEFKKNKAFRDMSKYLTDDVQFEIKKIT